MSLFVFRQRVTAKIPLFPQTPKPFREKVRFLPHFLSQSPIFTLRGIHYYIIRAWKRELKREDKWVSKKEFNGKWQGEYIRDSKRGFQTALPKTVCAHRKMAFLVCVRTQLLIYINKTVFFELFFVILLVTLQKARNFASSKGKKTVTSEWKTVPETTE